jgi:hypothetical protein
MSSIQLSKFQSRIRGERRGRKPRGRPHRYSGLTNHMRINDDLKEIIQYNQNAGETFNDTVLRMFREKAEEIKKVREENDRLTNARSLEQR